MIVNEKNTRNVIYKSCKSDDLYFFVYNLMTEFVRETIFFVYLNF